MLRDRTMMNVRTYRGENRLTALLLNQVFLRENQWLVSVTEKVIEKVITAARNKLLIEKVCNRVVVPKVIQFIL